MHVGKLYLVFYTLISSCLCLSIPAYSNMSKIIVIADLHADINRFNNILMDAKIINEKNQWTALPNTVIIQLGDQIDPKPEDASDIDDSHHFKMIHYTDKLGRMASTNNSTFISLIGNHELYNINVIQGKNKLRQIISRRPVILHLGNYIFCHGGFKKQHLDVLKFYNMTLSDVNNIWYKYVMNLHMTVNEEILLNNLILDKNDSILFTRTTDSKADADFLHRNMETEYIFVGHTAVASIQLINKVWYLDMYLKDAFDNMMYSYIVIEDGRIEIKSLEYYALLIS
jgi:hypothetical protein